MKLIKTNKEHIKKTWSTSRCEDEEDMKHIKKHMNLIKTNKEHIKKTWNTSRKHETHQETHETYQD